MPHSAPPGQISAVTIASSHTWMAIPHPVKLPRARASYIPLALHGAAPGAREATDDEARTDTGPRTRWCEDTHAAGVALPLAVSTRVTRVQAVA